MCAEKNSEAWQKGSVHLLLEFKEIVIRKCRSKCRTDNRSIKENAPNLGSYKDCDRSMQ